MYFTQDKITEIFVLADEFCKEFEKTMSNYTIGNAPKKRGHVNFYGDYAKSFIIRNRKKVLSLTPL